MKFYYLVFVLLLCSVFVFTLVSNDAYSLSIVYSPFRTSIDNVEVFDALALDTKDEYSFFIMNGNENIITIAKNGKFIKFNLDEESENNITLNIESNNPNVLVCNRNECGMKVTSDESRINIQYNNLKNITKTMGVYQNDIKIDILNFTLNGNIDDQNFSLHGNVLYDNSAESWKAFQEYSKLANQQWLDGMKQNKRTSYLENSFVALNSIELIYLPLAILIITGVTLVEYYQLTILGVIGILVLVIYNKIRKKRKLSH